MPLSPPAPSLQGKTPPTEGDLRAADVAAWEERKRAAMMVRCWWCYAEPGASCLTPTGGRTSPHGARISGGAIRLAAIEESARAIEASNSTGRDVWFAELVRSLAAPAPAKRAETEGGGDV